MLFCQLASLPPASRYGRVNYVLARRLELLKEVGRLQESLDVPGDVSYTCETAGHFYLYQVRRRLRVSAHPPMLFTLEMLWNIDPLRAKTFLFVNYIIKMEYMWLARVSQAFMTVKPRQY